jgi:hypothetical protein
MEHRTLRWAATIAGVVLAALWLAGGADGTPVPWWVPPAGLLCIAAAAMP